jgi:rRNA maturation endonuclease Nob1
VAKQKAERLSFIAKRIQDSKRIKPSKRFTEPLEYTCKRCKQSVELYIPAKVICSRCGKPMQIKSEILEASVEATPPLAKAA